MHVLETLRRHKEWHLVLPKSVPCQLKDRDLTNENRRRSTFENWLEQLFSSRTLPAQGGAVSPSPNIPIEATRVLEDDAKIEAQVQARMDKLIANITVPVDLQPGDEVEENDKKSTQPNRKRICFFAITAVLLILAVAVGTVWV